MTSSAEQTMDEGSWITTDFLQQVLQGVEPEQNISVINKEVTFAVGKGENYLSTLFRAEVQFKRNNTEEIEKCHLIVKGFPSAEIVQKFVNETGLFQREIDMYHTVFPEINNFVKKRLQSGSIPFVTPKVYPTTRLNSLVLSDLKYEGFTMANRHNLLDFQHCVLVVKNMARLHGMSAAFHQHNPDFLTKYDEIFYCEKNRESVEQFIPKNINFIIQKLKSWSGFEHYAGKLEKFNSGIVDKMIQALKRRDDAFNVLGHGDCWVNNYLFKYSSSGEVEDIRFVDFQLSKFGSPAIDLCYFLYTSPTNEVRDNNMEQLLMEYHKELSNTLTSLGCNPEVFTYQDLKSEMHRLASFGFTNACSILPVVLSDPEDVPDVSGMTEEELNREDFNYWDKTQSTSRFKETFQKLILHFDKLGLFD